MYKLEKLNNLIKKELNGMILKEIEFPQGVIVTITRVETSSNSIFSKVFVSVIPSERRGEVVDILEKRIRDIQSFLNKKLRIRPVPKIEFIKEKKTEEASRVEELLAQIKKAGKK